MAVVVATDGQSRARGPGSDHLTFNLTDAAKMSFSFYGVRACAWRPAFRAGLALLQRRHDDELTQALQTQ